ncbi:MAG TPA: hypothetical protein VGR35_06915 [Tepidisphaeraceae bacterium]|nr:hypothetical protein [Tepidisphaeraceae bacterium]
MTFNLHPVVDKRFREVAEQRNAKLGECLSAALAMFVRATADEQEAVLQQMYTAMRNPAALDEFLKPTAPRRSTESRKRGS